MSFFLNYSKRQLTVSTSPNPKAEVTFLEDILDAMSHNSWEDLVAPFDQVFEYHEDLKIATFSGVCASSEKGFEICKNQEAHNIDSIDQGRSVWGLDEDLIPSI